MEGTTDIAEMKRKLAFLYDRCSMSSSCMASWLESPDFVMAMTDVRLKGIWIDDRVVLDVASKILDEKNILKKNKMRDDFRFRDARRGINQLKRALNEQPLSEAPKN